MQSFFVIHPLQLPAGWKFSGPHIRCITWNNIYKARLSILILSKTYPFQRKDFTSNHARLLASGFVCQKTTKIMDPYLQYFRSVSSEVIITK
jgi:hypothetical protein